jgi:glucose/arabinose dehydrogenase
MTFGPDGNLYVANYNQSVDYYDGTTGEFIGSFYAPGNFSATDVTFGPDGSIYVASNNLPNIDRFDGTTKRWLGRFTSGGHLQDPQGLTFGPDGNLYVGSFGTLQNPGGVERFDGTTGQFIDDFIPNSSGTWGITFGPDGNLYVGRGTTVEKHDGQTGQLIRRFSNLNLKYARFLTFGPDGYLYVVNNSSPPYDNASVLRFDPETGAFIDVFVSGVLLPKGITFTPPPQ